MAAEAQFHFRIGWFLLAFALGVLYVYLSHPRPTMVYKYPTPYNAGKVIYEDAAGNCYRFNVKTLDCPSEHVIPQPIV